MNLFYGKWTLQMKHSGYIITLDNGNSFPMCARNYDHLIYRVNLYTSRLVVKVVLEYELESIDNEVIVTYFNEVIV